MPTPYYVTTPAYYVNDKPHIGHAYTSIAADLLVRFHRIAGRECFFLTGTDEHGSKIAEAAAEAGLKEQEFCDRIVATFEEAWKKLDINYDEFIRTTSKRHERAVLKILDVLRAAKTDDGQDVVYTDYYEGLYCTGCEKFLTEKELVDGLCPDHAKPPVALKEKNYFFRLKAFLPKIKARIESGELKILPEERKREVLGLIDQQLPDFSLSRERVKWGIPLSFDKSQVAYVWVDALSNYISAIGYEDNPETFAKWWGGAEIAHLMAKDILKFHCLFWPAMLMAANLKLPDTIFLHGFFTVDGRKMSKSLGNQIDPNAMVEEFGADGTRYLLLTQYPFGVDGDIQASRFVLQYNSDLANDLGNLLSRVVKLIESNFAGKLPGPHKEVAGLQALMELAESSVGSAYDHVENFQLHNAIADGISLVRATNKFFNDTAPWKLAKAGKSDELGGILYACCECLRIVSILLTPIMPSKMRELRKTLGLDDASLTIENAQIFFALVPGTPIKLEQSLFPRLEVKKKPAPTESTNTPANDDGLLDISEFGKVELKVAEILVAEKVDGADKLLKIQISLGKEKRQIVAGIAQHYQPEQLVGKRVVVVANLKPAKIRGIESNGMLLAAKAGGTLVVVTPDGDIPPGAKIS